MFIHIGNGNVIHSEEIIAIIDYNLISSSTIINEMMTASKRKKKVVGPKKNAKAVMITKDMIYFSTLSVSTLKKRSSISSTINKLDDYAEEMTL
ncbi:extracellular matrix regulator RemB [Oceanobacillus saliphilus]|uniref:extracellular matrix regulator RemB n=1 Tax=Oceanobacillus saliphilus TaxID=2925834 RepID=UPI00201D92C6|nr:extracellular matrix/biofilm biosynthesis regulator RemA family protein [Oceanobacillus saliphilus]